MNVWRTSVSVGSALGVVAMVGCTPPSPPPVPGGDAATSPVTSTPPASATASPLASAASSVHPGGPASAAASDAPPSGLKEPDIEYVPTPENVVAKMLEVVKVGKDDVLYDLGCGDARILVTAAKKFGARGFGFDVDPVRVKESRENAKKAGVEHLVKIEQRDIFTVDLSPATVVTLYLLPELNVRLIPQLEKLRPGARIVSHDFDMQGVEPEKWWTVIAKDHRDKERDREHYVYLWKTPLKKVKN